MPPTVRTPGRATASTRRLALRRRQRRRLLPDATFVTFLRGHSGRLVGAAFASDGRTIETASVDGTVRRYDCLICGTLTQLRRLADTRLRAVGQ